MTKPLQNISPGSEVTLHISLSTTDGNELISTFEEDPEILIMGDGKLPAGLDLALYGLQSGAEQTLTLTPEQAFGPHTEDKIYHLPRDEFPPDMELKPGVVIGFDTPEGEELVGVLQKIGEDRVKVDFNHPLAGMEVVFKVKIIAITTPTKNSMEPH